MFPFRNDARSFNENVSKYVSIQSFGLLCVNRCDVHTVSASKQPTQHQQFPGDNESSGTTAPVPVYPIVTT